VRAETRRQQRENHTLVVQTYNLQTMQHVLNLLTAPTE